MSDRELLRCLAVQYMEAAQDPANAERRQRAYDTNALKSVRPLVWVDEVPWHEMNVNDELSLACETEEARGIEDWFRKKIYQWKHFQGDMILEPYFPVYPAITNTAYGLKLSEHTISSDSKNHIVSHEYQDQLDSMEKLESIREPVVARDLLREQQRIACLQDFLGDVLPVQLVQTHAWYTCWDEIVMFRGMNAMLMDLAVEPELMHATIERFSRCKASEFEQMEKLGVYGSHLTSLHCTPHYSRELEAAENAGGAGRASTWLRANAQPFASVSPQMHDEYEIQYLLPLTAAFGFTYYGCCEPLSDRLDVIKKIPNLRKVGVSPWSRVEPSAEQLGGNYVFARKPNPALVAGSLDEEAIRNETRETVEACIRYGCPYELVLKDISTVSYKPQNLWRWVRIVEETIDQYY